MAKSIMSVCLRWARRKCRKIRRSFSCYPSVGHVACRLCQASIVIATLALAGFLTSSNLEYNAIEHFDPVCKINFGSKYIKPWRREPKAYVCPQTGIQLVDYQLNVIYIKDIRMVKLHNIECSYSDNSSAVWKPLSAPTAIASHLVHVQCLHNGQVIYRDMFPLIPSGPRNAKCYNESCDLPWIGHYEDQYDGGPMNILIVTVKSVSKNAFLRSMPRTRHVFETRGSILFPNVISKSPHSIDNFMALLRNCSNLEANCGGQREFLWERYHNEGYYTVYLEDSFHYALFKQRLPGVDYQWTDNRILEQYGNNWVHDQPYCLRNRQYHQVLQKLLLERFQTRSRLFVWLSLNYGNANEDDLSTLDVFLGGLLRKLDFDGQNDCVVLLVSDHGRITGEYRDVRDHYAERFNPIVNLMLPRSFNSVYPEIHRQITAMSGQLVNHNFLYDLMHALASVPNAPHGWLQRIKETQSASFSDGDLTWWRCPLGFPEELCPCTRTAISKSSVFMERLVDYTLRRVNEYFLAANHASDCAPLSRATVILASYIEVLQVYKIRFTAYARDEFRGTDLFEAYVQVTYRRPGHWKCERLTYQEQDARKSCLLELNIPSAMRPLCFC